VHVDVGIADFVIPGAITDNQKDSIGRRVVDEAMAVASAGRKAAHIPAERICCPELVSSVTSPSST